MRIIVAMSVLAFLILGCSSQPHPDRAGGTAVPGNLPAPTVSAQIMPTLVPTDAPQEFEGDHAYEEYLLGQMKFGARPPGSQAIRQTGDYIMAELEKNGWTVETQEFDFRGVPIRNVIGKFGVGQGPLIILGAHYDTRPRANMDKQNPGAPVPGANDGASGVAVLLELARTLDKGTLNNEVWLAFFDAEDNGSLNACDLEVVEMQRDSSAACDTTAWDWSVGANQVAENLTTMPAAVIVVDMVGDSNQNIHYEHNSDKGIQQILWTIADKLRYGQWFIPEYRWTMTDDHTPFLKRGIRAIDIIDFDYPPWHTVEDTADKVSAESLERVGRVLEEWLETGAALE